MVIDEDGWARKEIVLLASIIVRRIRETVETFRDHPQVLDLGASSENDFGIKPHVKIFD